jgi:hypothetical protein
VKELLRLLWGLCWLVWIWIQMWWASRGDKGVEADDPDKEREPQ